MKYGSVCSGIEAASVAWNSLGWEPQWLSEVEPFPCKVLKHHYPTVPNLGDMTKILKNEQFKESTIDVLVGGTPCQSFSLAGLRGGMADERGNLALEYCRIIMQKQPKWFLWENVPGVFSSNDGKDFACLLSAFTGKEVIPQGLGNAGVIQGDLYSVAWRVLDSQYFGVPQRRRRVFVVGHLGNDWRPPFAVLFERESLRRDFTPGTKKRQKATGDIGKGTSIEGFRMTAFGEYEDDGTASSLKQRDYKDATDLVCSIDCRNDEVNNEISGTLQSKNNGGYSLNYINPVVYQLEQITSPQNGNNPKPGDPAPPLNTEGRSVVVDALQCPTLTAYNLDSRSPQSEEQQRIVNAVFQATTMIRRLTPTECARLQGFPDNYLSEVPGATDTAMYKALGNSMTTNVMNWIGKRIARVEALIDKNKMVA